MAGPVIAAVRTASKPTFIYGLFDPRDGQIRYVGKTVLDPRKRASVHSWRAKAQPRKRHSMAWIASIEAAGLAVDVDVLEIVPVGSDWVEAEQFWIAYFRFVGATLCNHTSGGEGQTGYKQPPETIEKRAAKCRGAAHHRSGKPIPLHVLEALKEGTRRMNADPRRKSRAAAARRAGMSKEIIDAAVERLKRVNSDPARRAEISQKIAAAGRTPEARRRTSELSKMLWETRRDEIIAAQNAGKDDGWRAKHRASALKRWLDPDGATAVANRARRRIGDADLAKLKQMIASGEKQAIIAATFKIDQSMVSRIKSGTKYK